MLSSIIRPLEKDAKLEKERINSPMFDKKGDDSQFSVFRDYLGLINLVRPIGLISSLDSDLKDYPPLFSMNQRQRMDSLDSDAISDSSSGGSRSESDMLLDSISTNSDSSSSFNPKMAVDAAQTYAQTLESIIAGQKNVINRLSLVNKDSRVPKNNSKATVCVFCRNNGESQEFFRSHTLKDSEGNTTCPILRAYTCPLCKENGDKSHTIKYCPNYTPKNTPKTDRLLVMPTM
jgi:protein nanos 1